MKINKEINYQIEAIDFIQQLYSGENNIQVIKDKLLGRGVSIEKVEELLSKQAAFIKAIEQEVKVSEQLIPYFLMEYHEKRTFLIYFYIEYLAHKNMSYQDYMHLFLKQNLFEDIEINTPLDLPLVLKLINELKFDDSNKLALINFYLGGEALFQKILMEIDKVSQTIKNKLYLISDDLQAAYQALSTKDTLKNYLNEYLSVDKMFNGDEEVTLLAISCNLINISVKNDKMHIYVGYLGLKMHEMKNDISLNEAKLINILKTISDPTRFKILQILKSGTTYGNDIAKRVELTPATVNHHLNILVNERILKAEISDNDIKKVYYRLQTQMIDQFLEDLRRVLL